jgi:hypothetical protein
MMIPLSRRQRRIEAGAAILAMLAILASIVLAAARVAGGNDPPACRGLMNEPPALPGEIDEKATGGERASASVRPEPAGPVSPRRPGPATRSRLVGGTPSVAIYKSGNPGAPGLWTAVCRVESGGDPHAYNAREDAAGVAQIRPCVLADLARLGLGRFQPADRWNPKKARRIFDLYVGHYGGRLSDAGHTVTDEDLARIWNGGPEGWRRAATAGYWQRVREELRT